MHDLASVIGSGSREDFDTKPITVMFGVRDKSTKRINVSLTCDKLLETNEEFDIELSLKSSNPQVRIGRSKSVGMIRDSTGQ